MRPAPVPPAAGQPGPAAGRPGPAVGPPGPAATPPEAPAAAPPTAAPARLRLMTAADLDAVLALELELFGEEAWSRGMLEGELAQQPASRHYLVAVQAGVIIGYAGLLAAGTQADVATIAVTGGKQGQGTGAALLEALLAEARRRGCAEVFLEVRVDNLRAQGLYRSRGFSQIGLRRGYYQPSGADALVMRLNLADERAQGRGAAWTEERGNEGRRRHQAPRQRAGDTAGRRPAEDGAGGPR